MDKIRYILESIEEQIDKKEILTGHTSPETAYEVTDYPYGFKLRTSIFYWVESVPKKGDRFCSYTIDPKTGRNNKPKKSTFSPFIYMYKDPTTGYVERGGIAYLHGGEKDFENVMSNIDAVGVENINPIQDKNIRESLITQVAVSASWKLKQLEGDARQLYMDWAKEFIKHIRTAPLQEITRFDKPQPSTLSESTIVEHDDGTEDAVLPKKKKFWDGEHPFDDLMGFIETIDTKRLLNPAGDLIKDYARNFSLDYNEKKLVRELLASKLKAGLNDLLSI